MRISKNKFDIIVCGGGSAGFAAAVTVARQGAEVLLVEQFNCLGGTATAGLNYGFERTIGMNTFIYNELYEKMTNLGGTKGVYFDPEAYKYASQLMMEESGAQMLFHTFVESPIMKSDKITGINIVNKGGRQKLFAKVIIDATGDADIAAITGVPCEKGREADGYMQALTLRPRIGGVEKVQDVDWKEINKLLGKAIRNKTVNIPAYVEGLFDGGGIGVHGEQTFNWDMVVKCDATNPWQLSLAETESRKRVWELLDFSRNNIKGWENAYLIDTGIHIGVRETRRIKGKYILSKDDVTSCRKFDDGIARCERWPDLHDAEIFTQPYDKYIKKNSLPKGEWYEIPYRCLVPLNVENLLVAGRCISTDREANGSMRIMAVCMATGIAAGLAASMVIGQNTLPSLIDGTLIRQKLHSLGVDI
jgi:hypothetical protein